MTDRTSPLHSTDHSVPGHVTQNWAATKPMARTTDGGIVASQSHEAASVGARVLQQGGNAIDAAVATALALAAVEPWNSGLGGIGFMTVYIAAEKRAYTVDYSAVSPHKLDPKDFPMVGGETKALFSWPSVKDDRNIHGPNAIATPGSVAGFALALERFGTKSFAELIQPAIALADRGLAIDWFSTGKITAAARDLNRYETSRELYLPGGFPAVTQSGRPVEYRVIPNLAATMRKLAADGPRSFYEGAVAKDIVADIQAMGGVLDLEDLANYQARVVEPRAIPYRDHVLHVADGMTAGPTLARALSALADLGLDPGTPTPATWAAYARILNAVYSERLETMGDTSAVADAPATCTTHLNAIDAQGNMVALTNTLLSSFGSMVTLPKSGILMNNGVMWFDPRPGRANSLGPSKRPLSNMLPVVATRDGNPSFAIGASGGRRILPAVFQLISLLLDYRLPLDRAFHWPRLDASATGEVTVDIRHDAATKQAIARDGAMREIEHTALPANFACPSAVMIDPQTGGRVGISDVMSPWSGAVADKPA